MAKIDIGGQTYKVRQREVDGKKQEIYYRDGEAFIKDASGNLAKLNKSSDAIFKKASYNTQEYTQNSKENYANYLNSRSSDEDRPTLQGSVDANTFVYSSDLVGYKGKFNLPNGSGVNGIIVRDKDTNQNRILAERNNPNGTSVSALYAMNEETGEIFLESRSTKNPDGSGFIRKFNYETGEYDLTKIDAPKIETADEAAETEDANKLYMGGRLSEVVVTAKAPKPKVSPETAPDANAFEISTNFADYPKGKEALKDAVNISGLNKEQLAEIKDGTAVKVLYTGKDGKPKVIGGLMAGGNFTAPVDRTSDGKCYVGVFDVSKLVGEDNQINLQTAKIKTIEPKEELLANNE